jgi:putative acetyltransferase
VKAVDVRHEEPRDAARVRSVVAAAFESGRATPTESGVDPIEARLLDGLRADPASVTTGWVVEADGDVVGHLLVVPVTVGDAAASAIGMVAVDPAHQKKGYGAELVGAALGELIQAGETLVVVLGNPAYYGRFGFVPAPVVGVESPLYPSPYMQALPLRVAHPRGEITYPRPYRDLEA